MIRTTRIELYNLNILVSSCFDYLFTSIHRRFIPLTLLVFCRINQEFLISNQNRANVLMADNIKAIPAAAYYTAIPQLASRVMHDDEDTAKIVKRILERVLVKFPPQAMWHLAWLKGSKNNERSAIGGEIFKGAIKVLVKNRQVNVANLLRDSDSLFKFLQDLAR